MTTSPSMKPDLKVAPAPAVARDERPVPIARNGDEGAARVRKPARSLSVRLTRGFFQLLLPILVIAGGMAAYNYLKATKPEAPKRTARPTVYSINAVPVTFSNVRPELELFGSTVAGRQVEIRALVAGQVVETNEQLRDGGEIAQGAMIVAINPFDYRSAIAELEAQTAEANAKIKEFEASLAVDRGNLNFAREQTKLAETDLERAEPLSRRGAVTERTVDERRLLVNQRRQAVTQLENNIAVWEARIAQQKAAVNRLATNRERAEQRLAETKLEAPFNAYVTDVGAQVGRMISVNDRVATLIDRDLIEVVFTVTDRQFGRLVGDDDDIKGRKVKVRWNVGSKPLEYDATIDRISANVTSSAGGVQLYARVTEPADGVGLRPGAFVSVTVPDAQFDDVVRLPSSAIFDGNRVYVVSDGKLAGREVTIVAGAGEDVLVRGALKAGERVMTTRLSLPGDGVRVKEVAGNGA